MKDLKEKYFFPNALIYQASNVRVPAEKTIVPVRTGLGADDTKFGLELGAALAFAGESVGFVKYASDGTSLYDRWSPGGADFIGLKGTFTSGMAEFSAKGLNPRLCGILWMQGENDASFEHQAAVYGQKLREFIAAVRSYAGEVPFVVGETNPHNPYLPFAEKVNVDKRLATKEVPDVRFVSTEDLTDLIDNYHYGADHMLELGKRMVQT
ncbi:MAG: sialate O-acetylesterase, partial [Candidatus Gallimonas sp.]